MLWRMSLEWREKGHVRGVNGVLMESFNGGRIVIMEVASLKKARRENS